ncbi:MAG: GGDEF domain-containing protein [Burkholderiales bacterium]|nr:GGDEF domain-containing protein [Burkholderiales bacterium]
MQVAKLFSIIKKLELENQRHIHENKQLKRMAFYDSLTQLPNRFAFNEQIKTALNFSLRNKHKLAILFIDINGFKLINDTYGHTIGDLLLIQVAKCLCHATRNVDIVSRFGGDEFVVGLTSIHTQNDVLVVTDKIIKTLNQIESINEISCKVNVSIGACLFPDHSDNLVELLEYADLAMYRAKQNKASSVVFYNN